MTIYNMKPAWVTVMENTEETLGRKLTAEEINDIRNKTVNYASFLGEVYNEYMNLDGRHNNDFK